MKTERLAGKPQFVEVQNYESRYGNECGKLKMKGGKTIEETIC